MSNVDIGLLEAAADAAVQRALAATIVPIIRHGVIVDIDLNLYIHDVQMDGDTETIQVHDITLLGVPIGARVTVLFAPPHQAMIIGVPIHDSWHLVGTLGNASFNTGWGNDGSTGSLDTDTQPQAMYRRWGHLVEIRGGVVRTSGSSNTIWTMPEGYRPRNNIEIPATNSLTGHELIFVQQTGAVSHPAGGPGPWFFNGVYSIS